MGIAERILDGQDRDGMLRRSLERIIQLYTDKSHFVYELLQNAEDAKATSIKFVQYPDRLEVMHDGNPFTVSNLKGLCDIGKSDKINDLNQIGEFGVGFKSVFGICEKVELYSDPSESCINDECKPFSIEIRDFTKPEDIAEKKVPDGFTTLFIFPYAVGFNFSGFKNIDALNSAIKNRLENLGVTTLLFMRNLDTIQYEINLSYYSSSGIYTLKKKKVNDHCTLVSAYGHSDNDENDEIYYLKFTKPYDELRTVDIAFPIKIDKPTGIYTFVKPKSPYISVYFPTETESKLNFIVQGPFRTTPNRSSVPDDDEENIKLAETVAELLKESILELCAKKKMNISLMMALPMDESVFDNYTLFSPLYDTVWELFNSEAIIPTISGKYVNKEMAIIARNSTLPELFSDDIITKLINDKTKYFWLSTDLTETSYCKDVLEYLLDEHDVLYMRPEDLRDYIERNPKFLREMSDKWLVSFYQFYDTLPFIFQKKTSKNFLTLPFVKTNTDVFEAPFRKIDGEYVSNMFLPTKTGLKANGIKTVKTEIYEKCKSFFEETLHLERPNEYDTFKNELKERYGESSENIVLSKFAKDSKILVSYMGTTEHLVDLQDFVKLNFFLKCKYDDADVYLRPFSAEILFPLSESGLSLEAYYKNVEKKYFIDFDFYTSNSISYEALRNLGVKDNIYMNESLTSGEYQSGTYGRKPTWNTYNGFKWRLSIDKIDDVLLYISKHPGETSSLSKSQTIFRLVKDKEECLQGRLWVSNSSLSRDNENSEIVKILRNENGLNAKKWDGRWIYSSSGDLMAPSDISKYDIDSHLYGRLDNESGIYDLLGFKKGADDIQEEVRKDYSELTDEKKEAYLDIALEEMFGISREELNKTFGNRRTHGEEEKDYFEFPTSSVKNWEALKKHAAQILTYANPVKYQKVVRSVRVSKQQDDVKAYLKNAYRDGAKFRYACQMCHKPTTVFDACQIEQHPDVELDPLHVCLCGSCADKFRQLRNIDSIYEEFIGNIVDLSNSAIEDNEIVRVDIDDESIWFTQTHIAEIKELLSLKEDINSASVKHETDFEIEEQTEALDIYQDYVGKRVYCISNDSTGIVTKVFNDSHGEYAEISFEEGEKAGETKKFTLQTLIEEKNINFLD